MLSFLRSRYHKYLDTTHLGFPFAISKTHSNSCLEQLTTLGFYIPAFSLPVNLGVSVAITEPKQSGSADSARVSMAVTGPASRTTRIEKLE